MKKLTNAIKNTHIINPIKEFETELIKQKDVYKSDANFNRFINQELDHAQKMKKRWRSANKLKVVLFVLSGSALLSGGIALVIAYATSFLTTYIDPTPTIILTTLSVILLVLAIALSLLKCIEFENIYSDYEIYLIRASKKNPSVVFNELQNGIPISFNCVIPFNIELKEIVRFFFAHTENVEAVDRKELKQIILKYFGNKEKLPFNEGTLNTYLSELTSEYKKNG